MPRCTEQAARRTRLLAATAAILLAWQAAALAEEAGASSVAPAPDAVLPTMDVAQPVAEAAQPATDASVEPTLGASPEGLPDLAIPLLAHDLDLHGSQDEAVVPFNLAPGDEFTGATLALSYSNALAVLPDRSRLALTLNGKPLTDLPLVGAQGAAGAEIDLPPGLFRTGRNELGIALAQAHRLTCSRERFGELWTKLKRDGTSLALHRPGPRAAVTADGLVGLLSASAYDGEPLAIAAAASLAGPAGVELGARVAQAVALVRGDRPLTVAALPFEKLDWPALHGRNHVLLGQIDEFRRLLDPASFAQLAAERMLVRRLPGDPDHLAILFAGEDPAAVGRTVEGFVAGAARPLDPPPLPEIDGGAVLTLAELGFRTRELPLGVTEPLDLTFRLPPSFYAADGQRLELALNYAYAGGLQPTSALVIEVNGIPANMIRLDDPRGRIVDGARVDLTLGMFHPGINRISIHPMLDPTSTKTCDSAAPMLSLFEDGRITMPDFARLTHGGQLYDLVDDGFPYGEEPAAVMVSARDPAALGAAWTFLGKLAQRRGEVLDRLSFVPPGATPTEHLIAVGTADELSPSLVARLDLPWTEPAEPPAVPVAAGAATTPVAASVPDPRAEWQSRIGPEAGEGVLERLRRLVVSAADADVATPVPQRPARPTAPGTGGAMLVEVASPWAAQRVATVLVADRADHLGPGLDRLIGPKVWPTLGGDRAQWQADSDQVVAERRNPPFILDTPEQDPGQLRLTVLTWLAQNRWTWLGLMLAAVTSASLMTSLALRMRRH